MLLLRRTCIDESALGNIYEATFLHEYCTSFQEWELKEVHLHNVLEPDFSSYFGATAPRRAIGIIKSIDEIYRKTFSELRKQIDRVGGQSEEWKRLASTMKI